MNNPHPRTPVCFEPEKYKKCPHASIIQEGSWKGRCFRFLQPQTECLWASDKNFSQDKAIELQGW